MQHFLKVYSGLLYCPVKILKNTEQKKNRNKVTYKRSQLQKLFGEKLYTEQMSVDVALMKPCECYTGFPSAVKRQNMRFEIKK